MNGGDQAQLVDFQMNRILLRLHIFQPSYLKRKYFNKMETDGLSGGLYDNEQLKLLEQVLFDF